MCRIKSKKKMSYAIARHRYIFQDLIFLNLMEQGGG